MKEYPILCQTNLVRQIVSGQKTVTRRVITPQDDWKIQSSKTPYGNKGDILWVREAWQQVNSNMGITVSNTLYRADVSDQSFDKWKPSIHMHRSRARLFLKNEGVSIERLQSITPEQAIAEGIECSPISCEEYKNYQYPLHRYKYFGSPIESFATLWNSINAHWKPIKSKGKIILFVCYPWSEEDIPRIQYHQHHIQHIAYPNPYVRAINFTVEKNLVK